MRSQRNMGVYFETTCSFYFGGVWDRDFHGISCEYGICDADDYHDMCSCFFCLGKNML